MSINFLKKNSVISEDFNNCLLWKYLKIFRKDWTKVFIIKQLRNKEILVNNQLSVFNYRLKTDDIVTYIEGPQHKLFKTKFKTLNITKLAALKVIYEDEHVIVVDKETKISVQPNTKNVLQNMQNRLLNHLGIAWDEKIWKPAFIHRIDYNTCGVLIGAKNLTTFQKLSDDLKNKKINKWYKVLVIGKFPKQKITLRNWMIKENDQVFIVNHEERHAKEAISVVEIIKINKKTSLLKVQILTGRKHQIRLQLSNMGFPVCGDLRYGKKSEINKKYPCTTLCAWKVEFLSSYPEIEKIQEQQIEIEDIWFEKKEYLI